MDFYVLDDEIAGIEANLLASIQSTRLLNLIQLAWHLRQRDSQRAITYLREAELLLHELPQNSPQINKHIARCLLIHAEIYWLDGALEFAKRDANKAFSAFDNLHDTRGMGDCYFLFSSIHRDLGEIVQRDQSLNSAIEMYRIAGDKVRYQLALARSCHNGAIRDPKTTHAEIQRHFGADKDFPIGVIAWLNSARAIIANKTGQLGESCTLHIQAHRASLESGQIRQAILAATNAGDSFASLGDLDAALEWDETALAIAKQHRWPSALAIALLQIGNALRLLERHEDAREKLIESLKVQENISSSRTYAHTLAYLGDLSLDLGEPLDALAYFAKAEEKISAHNEALFLSNCWRGQAIAHCRLNQLDEADEMVRQALCIAREHHSTEEQIKCLRVYAELAKKYPAIDSHSLSVTNNAPNLSLYYQLEALELCHSIKGISIPADLLDQIADSYAVIEDFQSAFHYTRLAAKAKESKRLTEARQRAIAMQVRYDNERHRADAEYHKKIAESEAIRSASLQEASNTLETLGLIGRELTANLNVDSVFQALYRHVNELLDATSFGISLLEPDASTLKFVFGIENGESIPSFETALDHPISSFARCARERQEIVLEREPGATGRFIIPGTMETLSLLYTPLMIGQRLLGVMSIQSTRAHVYGERERSILRTLAAYGAIALDNASAYKQLQATLEELRETQNLLEEVSITDPLTGLRNRRFLLQNIDGDVARALRAYEDKIYQLEDETNASINTGDDDIVFFMVDLDHFKSVNDTYGHACGDLVLTQMRDRLQSVFRESDYLVRWGGEEFLVVARTCNRKDAPFVAERIRQVVANTPFTLLDQLQISRTCSVGYAAYPFLPSQPHLMSWAQVVNFADQGLYMVKKSGRNACIGIAHTATNLPHPEDFYNIVMRHPQQAAESKLIQILNDPIEECHHTIHAS
ncbi:GGDEF domain-containing protein [Undibacterium fentianense]|uniref:diguanylate cyclase n=1 Tax=Undibacterium fentianense TaxID=2828728 RepID=A0A941E4L5_9BURK|nr:GGDEF domain-containing protein [Undibacterium fentianense]MBR7798698.1 GGDEF domain-containing protein [Undibacterium fentianense]